MYGYTICIHTIYIYIDKARLGTWQECCKEAGEMRKVRQLNSKLLKGIVYMCDRTIHI